MHGNKSIFLQFILVFFFVGDGEFVEFFRRIKTKHTQKSKQTIDIWCLKPLIKEIVEMHIR